MVQRALDREPHEAYVQVAAGQGLELLRGGHVAQRHLHAGVGAAEARDQPRDQLAGGDAEAEPQHPELAAGGAADPLQHPVGVDQQGPDLGLEELPDRRQLGPVPAADEERPADLLLELPDLLGERWLTEVERTGGPAEVPLLGQGLEGSEQPELHDDNHK